MKIVSFALLKKSLTTSTKIFILGLFYIITLTIIVNKPSMNPIMFGFQIWFVVSRIVVLFYHFASLYAVRSNDEVEIKSVKHMMLSVFCLEYWKVKELCA